MKNMLRFFTKRVMPILIAAVMIFSFVPFFNLTVDAAGTLVLGVNGLSASWTDASNSKGSATWSGSGNSITGTATGYKNVINRTVTTTLTLTNGLSTNALLTFDYSLSGGSVKASAGTMADGKFSYDIPAGGNTVVTLTSPSGATSCTLIITNLSMIVAGQSINSTFLPATAGGSYTVTDASGTVNTVTSEITLSQEGTQDYTLTATASSGYVFFGWYSESKGTYLSYDSTVTLKFDSDPRIRPEFISSSVALFGVNSARFTDLTQAGTYAVSAGTKQINLLNSGTISGSHTIPAGITLLVPFDDAYTCYTDKPETIGLSGITLINATPNPWQTPYAYRTLTMASDAVITVNGAISVSAKHSVGDGSGQRTSGSPSGPCGFIDMKSGSQIILNSGSNLYAWGYIKGSGTITANSGAAVYENIQFTDFRGGTATSAMATDYKSFPMSQYYVQNIEVLTRYNAGSNEYVYCSIFMQKSQYNASVKFMGEGGMFSTSDGYVTKDYIEATDRLAITTDGVAELNGLTMSISTVTINSSDFVLPINSNIDIAVNSGSTTVNQSIAMFPGSTLSVAEGAEIVLSGYEITDTSKGIGVVYQGANNLFVYDSDNWTWGLSQTDNSKITGNFVHPAKRLRPLAYTTANGTAVVRDESSLKDVVFDINGTVIADGYLYTTTGENRTGNGASIISSGKTGQIVMTNGAGKDTRNVQANYTNDELVYVDVPVMPAQLRNADNSLTDTSDAVAGDIYYYNAAKDKWVKAVDVTITYNANGGDGTMNPTVADKSVVMNGGSVVISENGFTYANHEFIGWNTMADGSGTAYAAGDSVKAESNITLYAQWESDVNYVTYTWMNGDTQLKQETVEEGSAPNHPENPVKPDTEQYSYTFKEWTSAVDSNGNVTYTATFDQSLKSYEIIFMGADGVLYTKEYDYGTVPAYEGETPVKAGDGKHTTYTFSGWSPAFAAVTADVTYTAQFTTNVSACVDSNNNHKCDICDKILTACVDSDKNHACDICGTAVGEHKASAGKHTCDYCGEIVTDCVDNNKDHLCDDCGTKLTDCIDSDKNHACDICGVSMGEHKAADGKHTCDYCSAVVNDCVDADNDHYCDICGVKTSDCVDTDNDHFCNICGAEFSKCTDADRNHYCDICNVKMSECADTDNNHKCDVCRNKLTECIDENKDSFCDICGISVPGEYDATIKIATPETRYIEYGESVVLYATATGLPEGAVIKWRVVDGKGVTLESLSNGRVCIVTSESSGDVTIEAYAVNRYGQPIYDTDGNAVCDRTGISSVVTLWMRIVAYFRKIFPFFKLSLNGLF